MLDLHVHSALSPCAAREMSPPAVLLTAELLGLQTIGIVDHSSAGNAAAFLQAAQAFAVTVLVGLEVESLEGVHLLALFDNLEAAGSMDQLVRQHLPRLDNRVDLFGEQTLVDELGDEVGTEPRLLVIGSDLSVERLAEETLAREGLSIAAHIDRMSNGLLPTLGLIPPHLRVDLFELSARTSFEEAHRRWPELVNRPLMTGSDAHDLQAIGKAVTRVPEALARPGKSLRAWAEQLAEALARGNEAT
jgi:hypothetical protein